MQWLSSGLGGYLAGRLRTKWVGIHTDEVYFRDTAHGFLAWALATLLVVGVLGSALSSVIGSGVQAVSTVASGAAMGASAGASANAGSGGAMRPSISWIRCSVRPMPAKLAAADPDSDAAAVGQASRILIASAAAGEISADDKTYLVAAGRRPHRLVARPTPRRVSMPLVPRSRTPRSRPKQAADTARKGSATFALLGALSLVIGAFIASAAAALGGRQRDDEEAVFLTNR